MALVLLKSLSIMNRLSVLLKIKQIESLHDFYHILTELLTFKPKNAVHQSDSELQQIDWGNHKLLHIYINMNYY